MPCRDYEPMEDYRARTRTEKEQRDRLARIACRAMNILEGLYPPDELAVHVGEEAMTWYGEHKAADAAHAAKEAQKAEEARQRAEALALLTPTQRKLLGIKE